MPIARRVLPHIGADDDGTYDSRYYSKAEVDALLASISADTHDHFVDHYTKAEIDAALALKAAATHDHDDRYFTEAEVNAALALKAASTHTHDDRYYTKSAADVALALKANSVHDHAWADITGRPSAFIGDTVQIANVTRAADATTYDWVTLNIGPLVSGIKYALSVDTEMSFEGSGGRTDVNAWITAAGVTIAAWGDVASAEGGVDTGYSLAADVFYNGAGSTVTLALKYQCMGSGSGMNTRFARISASAIPVGKV